MDETGEFISNLISFVFISLLQSVVSTIWPLSKPEYITTEFSFEFIRFDVERDEKWIEFDTDQEMLFSSLSK